MRSSSRRFGISLTVALAFCLVGNAALADSIDGNWCSSEGRHVFIAGPKITTPGGTQIAGSYTRHAFSYVAPAGETGAGSAVQMQLLSEDSVRVTMADANPAVWHRCKAETS